MRGLQLQDVFTVVKMLKKMNLNKDSLKGLYEKFDPKTVDIEGLTDAQAKKKIKEAKEEALNSKGMEVLFVILENIGEAEEDFYKLIADLKQYADSDTARKMSFEELGIFVNEIREMKGLKGFFTQVSKFMK